MLDFLTGEERLAAEALFGFCWWCGARDDQAGEDPAHAMYDAFIAGRAGNDPSALMPLSEHAELGSTPDLALEILRHDKTRLAQHVASADEEWKRWRVGADVDKHLPAFVARGSSDHDFDARLAAARGLVYEAFRFGARAAAVSGGRHGHGFGPICRTAEHMAASFQANQFPVNEGELMKVIGQAASTAPGSHGVFVVIPFLNQDDPSDLAAVRENADQLVAWLAHESPLQLTAHVLEDRDLVARTAEHLQLGQPMMARGILVAIPLADPTDPDNIPGVLRNAAFLVDFFAEQAVPARVVDDPALVSDVADRLAPATN